MVAGAVSFVRVYGLRAVVQFFFFFSSRRRHTRSVSAFLLNRSSDLGQIGRLITISTTPVIAGDSFEMDAVGALRLSPLRRGLAIVAVRYTQDAFSRSGWLWPVDAKGEPLKATSYMRSEERRVGKECR